VKVSQNTAEEVKNALIKKLKPIQNFVLTLTADNGKEFAYPLNLIVLGKGDLMSIRMG